MFKLEQIDFALICLIFPFSLSICVFEQAREAVREKTALTKFSFAVRKEKFSLQCDVCKFSLDLWDKLSDELVYSNMKPSRYQAV